MPLLECENKHLFNGDKHGNVCPRCGLKVSGQKNETEPEPALAEAEYVCGWLVCIKGPDKGRSYPIHAGRNFIGSGSAMDIQIQRDGRIRNNHAVISYDPGSREVLLLPGSSSGMVYLQGKALYEPSQLEAFQEIDLGNSRLAYAPFCGAGFDWSDHEEEEGQAK